MSWAERTTDAYSTTLMMLSAQRSGLVMDVATALNTLNAKARTLTARDVDSGRSTITITVEVHDLAELRTIISRLSAIRGVIRISRSGASDPAKAAAHTAAAAGGTGKESQTGGQSMRAVVTRVTEASVTIDGAEYSRIGRGFLVLLGVHVSDTAAEADRIVDRICGLRVFEDTNGKMNVNPADAGAELLIVSQFTLFADCRSRRPGFTAAARPETAVPLYERVIAGCEARGFPVRTGVFGADMKVASVNDGPVTILLDTDHL